MFDSNEVKRYHQVAAFRSDKAILRGEPMRKKSFALCSFSVLLASFLQATDITIYNDDLALVKEVRSIALKKGLQEYSWTDIPSQIDATSLHFKGLGEAASVKVLEQNFEYDLLNVDKMLAKFIGRPIEWERPAVASHPRDILSGTLLSTLGGAVIQVGEKIYVNPEGRPILPERPEGFVLKPTLQWKLSSPVEGTQECEVGFLTAGLSWRCDYVLTLNPSHKKMDMNTWVTVNNQSGVTYPEAQMKLVAGDVHRAPEEEMRRGFKFAALQDLASPVGGFSEKSLFEYHLYTLGRKTTLKNNETKQIEMAQATGVPVKKCFIYDPAAKRYEGVRASPALDLDEGATSENKVYVELQFKNSPDYNLGLPLPKGLIRVYQQDEDGILEFIGEDRLDHTPKNEIVKVRIGNAFDVVGERQRTDFKIATDKKSLVESFDIALRNQKTETIEVAVVERLYRWSNWKIIDPSSSWVKKNSQTIEFNVPIPPGGEKKVHYSVKYSW